MFKTRYRRILWFFARVLLHLAWWDILLPHVGLRSLTRRTRAERLRRIAGNFRVLAIDMGGVMIKVASSFLHAWTFYRAKSPMSWPVSRTKSGQNLLQRYAR